MHDELEKRLDTALEGSGDPSPLPDAIAAHVRRRGHIRRAKSAAFGIVPIALVAGLMVMQFRNPSVTVPDGPKAILPEPSPVPGDEYRGLIASGQLASIFSDRTTATIVPASTERVFSFRDAYNADVVEDLFSGS